MIGARHCMRKSGHIYAYAVNCNPILVFVGNICCPLYKNCHITSDNVSYENAVSMGNIWQFIGSSNHVPYHLIMKSIQVLCAEIESTCVFHKYEQSINRQLVALINTNNHLFFRSNLKRCTVIILIVPHAICSSILLKIFNSN